MLFGFCEFESHFYKNPFVLTFVMVIFYFILVWVGLKSIKFFKIFFVATSNKFAKQNVLHTLNFSQDVNKNKLNG